MSAAEYLIWCLCQWPDVLSSGAPRSAGTSVALGCRLRPVVDACGRVLWGTLVNENEQITYDVYVKTGADRVGRDQFGATIAHFLDQSNAVALKRRSEARGETVRIEKSVVRGLSEVASDAWFSNYKPQPPQSNEYASEDAARASAEGEQEPADKGERPPAWWRKIFSG